jgi:hypothetical protein
MSRRVRLLTIALIASFAFSAAACGDLTAPGGDVCTIQGSGTCADLTIQGSGT